MENLINLPQVQAMSSHTEFYRVSTLVLASFHTIGQGISIAASITSYLYLWDCGEYGCDFEFLQKFIVLYLGAFALSNILGAWADVFHIWVTLDSSAQNLIRLKEIPIIVAGYAPLILNISFILVSLLEIFLYAGYGIFDDYMSKTITFDSWEGLIDRQLFTILVLMSLLLPHFSQLAQSFLFTLYLNDLTS